MSDSLHEKWAHWSLERVRFLLSHIENFVEDDSADLREKARQFSAQTGLDKVQRLVEAEPSEPGLPGLVLDRLAPFFEAGLLLQRGMNSESSNWWVTDIFWRGITFHLEMKDQVRATGLVPEITPLQVHRAPTEKILSQLKMNFLLPKHESDGYLLRPTPTVAYVLFSTLAAPWANEHLGQAHTLVNKCFLY